MPVALLVVADGDDADDVVVQDVQNLVRDRVGAFAALKACAVVGALPKTRSGKILRNALRALADDEAYKLPGTIEDARVIDDHVVPALKSLGYASRA